MPFGEGWPDVVFGHIKEAFGCGAKGAACSGGGPGPVPWVVRRADLAPQEGVLMRNVRRMIEEADLIVADLTFENPNVMYEIGCAHEQGKPVILLYEPHRKRPPVDVAEWLRVEYCLSKHEQLPMMLAAQVEKLLDSGRVGEACEFWRLRPGPTVVSVPWRSVKHEHDGKKHHYVRSEAAWALARLVGSPYLAGMGPRLLVNKRPPEDVANHIAIGGPITNRNVCANGDRAPVRFRGIERGASPTAGARYDIIDHHGDHVWLDAGGQNKDAFIVIRTVTESCNEFSLQGLHAPQTLWAVRAALEDAFWRRVIATCRDAGRYVRDGGNSICVVGRTPPDLSDEEFEQHLDPTPQEVAFVWGKRGGRPRHASAARGSQREVDQWQRLYPKPQP